MSNPAINEQTGMVNVYELLPRTGDAITIVNCGTHFEIRHQHWDHPPLILTDEDIEFLKAGKIVWN